MGRLSPTKIPSTEVSSHALSSARVIARVEPLTTTRRLSGPFDYRGNGGVGVGSVVRIPFGRQALDGVVVELAETSALPDERLVSPTAVGPDSGPAGPVPPGRWAGGRD